MLDLLKEIGKGGKSYGIPTLLSVARLMEYPYYTENH